MNAPSPNQHLSQRPNSRGYKLLEQLEADRVRASESTAQWIAIALLDSGGHAVNVYAETLHRLGVRCPDPKATWRRAEERRASWRWMHRSQRPTPTPQMARFMAKASYAALDLMNSKVRR